MPIWVIPAIYTIVSLIATPVLPRIERDWLPRIDIGIAPGSAIAMLSSIASGMMALTGIVFSVAFVMVQFSAVTYSPRLAMRFAQDRLLYHCMGAFFATFTYSLAATAWSDRHGAGTVPTVSLFFAVILLIISLSLFTVLVRRLSDLQIGNTLRNIGNDGRRTIKETFAPDAARATHPRSAAAWPEPAPGGQVLRAEGEPLYVQRVDIGALVNLARKADGCIVMECAVGDMVAEGSEVLRVVGAARALPEVPLRRAVRLGTDRTFTQDPKYPLRLLVDIAIKALSPAINDPTTAVQAMNQIEDLLRRLARCDLDVGAVTDAEGKLSLAFDEIRMFGVGSVQVMRRLRAALHGLAELTDGTDRAERVRRYLAQVDRLIERTLPDEEDRQSARQDDPQGLGLSR